jgi:hypothetical protein
VLMEFGGLPNSFGAGIELGAERWRDSLGAFSPIWWYGFDSIAWSITLRCLLGCLSSRKSASFFGSGSHQKVSDCKMSVSDHRT